MSKIENPLVVFKRKVMAEAQHEVERTLTAVGALQAQLARLHPPTTFRDSEYKVFSQWGEDGILQYLIGRVPIEHRTFVEIGVESYAECNTRFLATHSNWSGIAVDAGTAHVDRIRREGLDWRYGVRPVTAFVTRENINTTIGNEGLSGDIGVMSIDVDGVDYWLLEAVDVVSPRILVLEYISAFGADKAVTVPYKPTFVARREHHSGIYLGASLAALAELAQQKGYVFVGCESHGSNAFFVRRDVAASVEEVSLAQGYVEAQWRITRSSDGELDYESDPVERLRRIAHMPIVETVPGHRTSTLGEVYGLQPI